jgi:uncharacterized protein YqhQ
MAEAQMVKVGGQALADGVLMRTSRAWAIARADGSVDVGAVAPSHFARIPVLRVVGALFGALRLAVVRGLLGRGRGRTSGSTNPGRRLNRRFLAVVVGLEVAAYLAGRWVTQADLPTHGWTGAAITIVPWIATLAVMRVATPGSLWRYHGAEHKAVSAHEQGVDLADTASVLRASRVHNRCGTNLVFVMLALVFVVQGHASGLWQVPLFLGLIGVSAEVVTLAATRPTWLPSRALLAGGKALQRWVTTAEPTAAEQAVGCLALRVCLDEHARIVALDDVPAAAAAVPALAAA